ncbi:MAG: hypothetical protein C3F15_15690 [Holophagae bacterium]|nr:MAG: hypothetical protein C3F15_15690 [Holophagae bacterium]
MVSSDLKRPVGSAAGTRASLAAILILLVAAAASAQTPPCAPCVGLEVDDPEAVVRLLGEEPPLGEGTRLYLRWRVPLDGTADPNLADRVAAAGATPWLVLSFRAPSPIADHAPEFAAELEEAARLAAAAPPSLHCELAWEQALDSAAAMRDYAFLVERASVAVTGAQPEARVITGTLPRDRALLEEFYAADVAAYLDGLDVGELRGEALAGAVAMAADIDPGRRLVHGAGELPEDPWLALPEAARSSAAGATVSFFRAAAGTLATADLQPLLLLAREFSGDLAYDPYSAPAGGSGGWAFVRAEDLGLAVIVDRGEVEGPTVFTFSDRDLRNPVRVHADGTTERVVAGSVPAGFMVEVAGAEPVAVLRLERPTAAELGGFAEQVDVSEVRGLPVEEILRRLQAFEDAQDRRLHHYEATYTQHFRYRPGEGIQVIEASFSGPYFYHRGEGFDWVWQRFLVNGVLWRGQIPKLPLLQPARAAARPLEIHLDRQYRYSLRGTDTVNGRDCWVVDFEPSAEVEGANLWKGTVWVDRQLFARVKTRALQLGLSGDVISNEQTTLTEPVDAAGNPAPWDPSSFFLPTRVNAQELQSILNTAVQVEKESFLTDIRINADGFAERLAAAYASPETMLRDTPGGLRYLDRNEDGTRVVRERDDPNRWFALGGVYWDETQDYPVPLVGIDFFSSDFQDTGAQVNLLFAGVLLNGNWAEPSLFGSRWDAGARVFGFFLAGDEELYRDGELAPEETVTSREGFVSLYLGRPIGSFLKLDASYGLEWDDFGRADDTAAEFVVPESTWTSSLGFDLSYSRSGYRLGLQASANKREKWEFWGFPGNGEYSPDQQDFTRWSVVLGKTWWPGSFGKLGVELEHLDGSDLDRFSKYDFSTFGLGRVAGYQGGLVTASSADGVHAAGGLNIAEALRLEGRVDVVWATDEATGLDRELLAGVGLNGTVIGPWQTVVNFDVGVPVAGPADSFTVFITFLKLFK